MNPQAWALLPVQGFCTIAAPTAMLPFSGCRRVTLVFRRAGDRWQLVHRHADPLVRQIPFEHCAQLARGLDT